MTKCPKKDVLLMLSMLHVPLASKKVGSNKLGSSLDCLVGFFFWAAIGRVWTRHCRSNCACPTAFIALSVHHMFIRPLALLMFQTVPGPCLPGWGQSCGSRVLGFTAWAHYSHDTESGSWRLCGVPCLGCLYTLVVLACAGPSWPHTLGFVVSPGHGGLAVPRGQELAGLVATTNPSKSWWSLGLKSPSGYWSVGVSGHIQKSTLWGGGGANAG